MNNSFKSFLLIGSSLVFNQTLAQSHNAKDDEIYAVINTFKSAIIAKDEEAFKNLFYSDDIPWIAVFTDEMVNKKRITKPDFPRTVNFGKFSSPITMLSGEEEQQEKISNVQIINDGYLASVHFDYKDCEEGKQKAWGTESWGLVKEELGWKINSVTFSVTEGLAEDNIDHCAQ